MPKPRTEYMIACVHYPKAGHKQHVYPKSTRAKADQAVIDQNHHADMLRSQGKKYWQVGEAPWRVMQRQVGAWEDATDE